MKTLNQKGVLHIPLLIAMLMIFLSGFGIWSVFRDWRFHMETQLRLNQCVGEAAQSFRGVLSSIEAANLRIQALRASITAAKYQPWLIPPLEVALTVEVALQEITQMKWKAQTLKWMAKRGCGKRGDRALPLPELEYDRKPPDDVGPQALQWRGKMPDEFFIQAGNPPRFAAASVKGENHVWMPGNSNWSAIWSVPRKSGWSGID